MRFVRGIAVVTVVVVVARRRVVRSALKEEGIVGFGRVIVIVRGVNRYLLRRRDWQAGRFGWFGWCRQGGMIVVIINGNVGSM